MFFNCGEGSMTNKFWHVSFKNQPPGQVCDVWIPWNCPKVSVTALKLEQLLNLTHSYDSRHFIAPLTASFLNSSHPRLLYELLHFKYNLTFIPPPPMNQQAWHSVDFTNSTIKKKYWVKRKMPCLHSMNQQKAKWKGGQVKKPHVRKLDAQFWGGKRIPRKSVTDCNLSRR